MTEKHSSSDIASLEKTLALAERRLVRSEAARTEAETLLDTKSRSLAALEQQLRQQQTDLLEQVDRDTQKLISAQNLARVATFHIDADGRFVGSENLARVIGSRIPVTNLQQMIAMIHPLEPAETMRVLMDAIAGGLIDKPSERDVRFLDHYGQSRWLRWSITEKREDHGFGYSAVGSVRDITDDRKAEREQRTLRALSERRFNQLRKVSFDLEEARKRAVDADRSRSRFLAMMSHDIRTPMNALLATLELLGVSDMGARQKEMLRLAMASGDQLLRLLADIIELARSGGWKIILDERDLDLEGVVRATAMAWQPLARKKRQDITVTIDPALPEAIVADGMRLRQLLDNFISNAIKYTGAGSIAVSAERVENPDQPELRISVTDSGDGIPQTEQQRLFEDLQMRDSPDGGAIEGTGMGLPICRRIVEAMDGRIGVDSEPGQGSHFWFRVPLRDGAKERVISREVYDREDDAPTVAGRPLHLLVAEDVEANRIVMASMLDRSNCTYEMVTNGVEALSMLPKGNFDAILMDVSMPQMDGIDATRHIRRNTEVSDIPIYGVTAFAAEDERRAILAAGMDGLLTKPVSLASLHDLLQQIIGKTATSTIEKDGTARAAQPGVADRAIDGTKLREQLLGVPEDMRDRLGAAIENDLAAWYEKFGAAWSEGDREALSRAHHALKGICRLFGAGPLFEMLDQARAGKHDRLDEADAVYADTIAAVRAIIKACRQDDPAEKVAMDKE